MAYRSFLNGGQLEMSQEDAVTILMGLRSRYEEHHRCHITSEAVEAAVYLSSRYIADRFLPDKAIDLLDEAGSRARINSYRKRKELQTSILTKSPSEYWQEIRAVQASQETVISLFLKLLPLYIFQLDLSFFDVACV